MAFSEAYLHALAAGRVVGDFAPFTLGSPAKIEHYVQKLVERLRRPARLVVEADFNSYGSGYASYVVVRLTKKQEAAAPPGRPRRVPPEPAGLLLYVSRLAPYWFYGSGDDSFLEPVPPTALDPTAWQAEQDWLVSVFTEFRYGLLTAPELGQPAPASLTYIPTELAEPPYRVFDCFFYWRD